MVSATGLSAGACPPARNIIVFNPAQASQAAAAFSALLAALLFAVLGQLAAGTVEPSKVDVNKDRYPGSLALGLVLLVSLLSTTYLFVLLAGIADPMAANLNAHCAQVQLLRTSAFLFIIAGSALAIAAAVTLLFLGLVLAETKHTRAVIGTAYQTLVGGIMIASVLLAFGYDDIISAFEVNSFWLLVAVLCLAVPVALSLISLQWLQKAAKVIPAALRRLPDKYPVPLAITWLVALPVVVFRTFMRHRFDYIGDGDIVGLVTCGWALWAGGSSAACIIFWRTRIAPQ